MPPIRYFDFNLEIQTEGDSFRAHVRSPGGEADVAFGPLFNEIELENYLLKLGQPRRSTRRIDSPAQAAAKSLGKRLFEAVFANDVRSCLRSSLEIASQQDAGLRLRLHLKNVPGLANLPWEYIYDEALDRFLALSRHTPLVRYLPLPESIRPLKVSLPLRILAMISGPSDYQRLDVEREWSSLNAALQPMKERGLVAISRLKKATAAALDSQLQQDEFHVFHYIGHGGFDSRTQNGLLVLEDDNGKGRLTSGERLGVFLHDHRSMRLAVLNACEGARSSTTDPFAGVAQTLIQQRIPAVVGMQFEITDEAAITFAKKFYSSIVEGLPVDTALTAARMTIYAENDGMEWGTPVLYMRSPDGHIFDLQASGASGPQTPKPAVAAAVEEQEPRFATVVYPAAEDGIQAKETQVLPDHAAPEVGAERAPLPIPPRRYSHHVTAFALAGRFSRPIQESIVPRVAIALPETGGQVSQRTEGFRMLETLSFASAQGTATGIESEDATFRTSVTVVVEGLNILGLITADRVVARLAASCTVGSRELSVASTGSTFDNLRIAGYPVRVGFASRVVPNSDSHLNAVKVLAPRRQDPLDSSPRPSLVKNIDTAADLRFSGKVISIPQFGTIYLGELEVLPQFERLTMLRVELDSSIIGSVVVASCECGGVRLVQ